MPTMSWNRVDGFEGNEPQLGKTSSRRVSDDLHQNVNLLSEQDYAYSDYYKPKGANAEKVDEEDMELATLNGEAAELKAFQEDHKDALARKKKLNVILPDSRFRKVWVNVQLFVVLYIVWVTPVRVGFNKPAEGVWFWLEGVIDLFFYTDLVLNFFTAYEHPVTGELITSHKKIALRYLKTWFAVDLLATIPVDYIVRSIEGTWGCSIKGNCALIVPSDSAASLVVMLRLLRVFRILWIFKNFNVLSISTVLGRLQDEIYMARWVLSLLELLIVLVFLGHLSGCFFYLFSGPNWQTPVEKELINAGETTNWVLDKLGGYYVMQMPTPYTPYPGEIPLPSDILMADPQNPDHWYQCPPKFYTMVVCKDCEQLQLRCEAAFKFAYRYITSMYWAYTTMTTVGYGDIAGMTIAEKVWCMVTMVIGGFFLSFCFGRMASVISRLDADKVAAGEQLHELSAFMKDVELPRPLAKKVLEYHKKQKVRGYDRQAVLARLPFELRAKILRHLYLPTIQTVPLLQAMAQDDVFLTDLCVRLQPTHFSAETYVYQRGEAGADIFILLQGELHVLAGDSGPLLYQVPDGTVFGESSIITQMDMEAAGTSGTDKLKRRESVLCKTPCDMLKLPAEDVHDMCDHYPELTRGLRKLDKVRRAHVAQQGAGAPERRDGTNESTSLLPQPYTSPVRISDSGARAGTRSMPDINGLQL